MNIIAISGSYQKGRTIDTLIAEAIKGVRDVVPDAEIETIRLVEHRIEYCRGCLVCHGDDPSKHIARCSIQDDMTEISRKLDEADGYIIGSPVYEGTITAVTKCFLERLAWVLARPGHKPLEGCPEPRNPRKKAAICITSTGLLSGFIVRHFCTVTRVFKDTIPCTFNAPIIGTLYACNVGIKKPGQPERYLPRALQLGRKLARRLVRR